MGDDGESLAILPRSMGDTKPGQQNKRKDPKKYIPVEKGGLLTENPNEEVNPYTFSDSPAYVAKKKFEEQTKRAAELEQKDETRGFLRHVEELGKKHKWEEAFQVLEKRTAVPSGLFLVTRAVLRWKFCKYSAAFRDIDDALKSYGSSAKSGPLAAALSCFVRICMGSEAKDKGTCSKEMKELVAAWEQAEEAALCNHSLGKGLFHPRVEERLAEPTVVVEGMEAQDGSYVAVSGMRLGYTFLKNRKDSSAPLLVHFHGTMETAADYRAQALAEKYRDLPVHLLVVDYRGYGWSGGEPSLATFLRDAEPLAEQLPELAVRHGLAWPYPSGIVLSGRSLGAQVAVHLAARFPGLFRGLLLDSALATSATGDRLGRATERQAALQRWRSELEKASLEVLHPLDSDFQVLSVLEKIRGYDGQLLILHGLADEIVPYEGSESLHAAATTRHKEVVLVEGAGHNNIGHFENYWSSQRRFVLKIQLDDSLPKVGANVEHICAVCASKAVSKCGRCQKVWYCSRQCQAEHWKEHKFTCAGGPPEPKVKVEPEAEACLVAAVVANLGETSSPLAHLASTLASLVGQQEKLQAIYLSWHAEDEALAESVLQLISDMQVQAEQAPLLVAARSPAAMTPLEHAASLSVSMAQDVPPDAWVTLIEVPTLWSSRFVSSALPALRRAAADARVLAINTPRSVQAKDILDVPQGPEQLEAGVASGTCVITDDDKQDMDVAMLLVRLKPFRAFFESTPASVLKHSLAPFRFCHRLQHTYGKKVQRWTPPDGEWLCWRPSHAVTGPQPDDFDQAQGSALLEGARPSPAAGAEGDEKAEGSDVPQSLGNLGSAEDAALALARLRRAVERRLVQHAGETLAKKEFKALTTEEMAQFLEETELDRVVGVQKWAKQVSVEIAERAAQRFMVEIA